MGVEYVEERNGYAYPSRFLRVDLQDFVSASALARHMYDSASEEERVALAARILRERGITGPTEGDPIVWKSDAA